MFYRHQLAKEEIIFLNFPEVQQFRTVFVKMRSNYYAYKCFGKMGAIDFCLFAHEPEPLRTAPALQPKAIGF